MSRELSISDLSALARQDVAQLIAGLDRDQRKARAVVAEKERQAAIAKNKPSWDHFRAEQDLKALLNEVSTSGGEASPEHRARAGRLLASLGGGKE